MLMNKKILVVEDDADISTLIAYNLTNEGFSLEQSFDGIKAMQRINEEVFSIVILDIMLAGINGFDICRQIKEDPRYCRSFIIVVSAKCHPQDKLYAHILGADYYLTKPFSLAGLLGVVREVKENLSREFIVRSS
jgi:two-component system, OmpR family, alkaline phosphatase synthesis response regulator PhoP